MNVEFGALGPLEARVAGRPLRLSGPRVRALLAMLLCRVGTVVPADELAGAIWPDAARVATGNLQVYVHRLRGCLPPAAIEFRPPGYRLAVEPGAYDVRKFERLVALARAHARDAAPDAAVASFDAALAMWRGEPFAGITELDAVRAERDRLADLRLSVVEERLAAMIVAGRAEEAESELAELATSHPWRSRPVELRLQALRQSGRYVEAARLGAAYAESEVFDHVAHDHNGVRPDGGPSARDLTRSGDVPGTIRAARQALRSGVGTAAAHQILGVCLREQGRFREAYAHITAYLGDSVAAGDVAGEAEATQMIGIVERERGRYPEANRCLDRAERLHRDLRDPAHSMCILLSRGELRLRSGDRDARRLIEDGLAGCADGRQAVGVAYGSRLLGELHLREDRPRAALPMLAEAARLSRSAGGPFALALSLVHLGRAHALADQRGDASRAWRRAAGIFGTIGNTPARDRMIGLAAGVSARTRT